MQSTHKKRLTRVSKIITSFISEMQAFDRIRIYQNKTNRKIAKSKQQDKPYKYEKPKPNKHTEKGFYKNGLKYFKS